MRALLLHAASAALITAFSLATAARADGPSWYKHEKQVQKEKAEEQKLKDAEKPVVGGDSGDSGDNGGSLVPLGPVTATSPHLSNFLLFKKEGFTDSFGFSLGRLNQPDLNGRAICADYSPGWWASPSLVASIEATGTAIIADTYMFALIGLGPRLRYFLTRNWIVTGFAGYALSRGFSRVNQASLPYPPNEDELATRRGPIATLSVSYLFYTKREFGIGPSVNYELGTQTERHVSMFSIGLTMQVGRPNYTGDLTSW